MTTLDAIWQPGTHQSVYRKLLHATSYPGTVEELGEPAWLSLLATLCDDAVTLADPGELIDERAREFLRARAGEANSADFVLLDAGTAPRTEFVPRLGDLENPEFGATLVLVGECIGEGPLRLRLSGPGVESEWDVAVTGFHPAWFKRRDDWVATFPLGVDVLICDRQRVAALPRTTSVKLEV